MKIVQATRSGHVLFVESHFVIADHGKIGYNVFCVRGRPMKNAHRKSISNIAKAATLLMNKNNHLLEIKYK